MISQLKRLGLGMGKNPLVQDIADYGTAAALGVAGQQAMNWVSPGADPNPLISGALMAPALAYGGRFGRWALSPDGSDMAKMNRALGKAQGSNPYSKAALYGSAASLAGGTLASGYNTSANGADIDNNLIAAGAGTLGALAPIAYSLILNRKARPKSQTISID